MGEGGRGCRVGVWVVDVEGRKWEVGGRRMEGGGREEVGWSADEALDEVDIEELGPA